MNELMAEVILHWVAVACYFAATAIFAHALVFAHPQRLRWGMAPAGLGLLVHGTALILRWVASDHGPYMAKYEVLSSQAWVAAAVVLGFMLRRPRWAAVGLVVMPIVILLLGLGLLTSPEVRLLPPTLRSVWLVFHVVFTNLAVAAFLLSIAAAVLLLVKSRGPRDPASWIGKLPDVEALEAYTGRFVGFGFIFWTTTVGAGAIWANESWGRYWGWDPIETWSLITWLCYGSYLHVRHFFKLRPTTSAIYALCCLAVVILTLFILPVVTPSIHAAYFQ